MELDTKELIALTRDRRMPDGMTHWDGCEIDHDECLIQRMAEALAALLSENERLRAELAAAQKDAEHFRSKLQRVRDSLKFAANSPGGLVAEIDAAMAKDKRDD